MSEGNGDKKKTNWVRILIITLGLVGLGVLIFCAGCVLLLSGGLRR
jgi:hypothetical protein